MTPFFPPFSSTPTNIATVEAAKAKGTHGCEAQISCLCFVCVVHPLNTVPPSKSVLFYCSFSVPTVFISLIIALLYITLLLVALALSLSVGSHWFHQCKSGLCGTFHLQGGSQAIKEA